MTTEESNQTDTLLSPPTPMVQLLPYDVLGVVAQFLDPRSQQRQFRSVCASWSAVVVELRTEASQDLHHALAAEVRRIAAMRKANAVARATLKCRTPDPELDGESSVADVSSNSRSHLPLSYPADDEMQCLVHDFCLCDYTGRPPDGPSCFTELRRLCGAGARAQFPDSELCSFNLAIFLSQKIMSGAVYENYRHLLDLLLTSCASSVNNNRIYVGNGGLALLPWLLSELNYSFRQEFRRLKREIEVEPKKLERTENDPLKQLKTQQEIRAQWLLPLIASWQVDEDGNLIGTRQLARIDGRHLYFAGDPERVRLLRLREDTGCRIR
jgi:hypothetical protein